MPQLIPQLGRYALVMLELRANALFQVRHFETFWDIFGRLILTFRTPCCAARRPGQRSTGILHLSKSKKKRPSIYTCRAARLCAWARSAQLTSVFSIDLKAEVSVDIVALPRGF